jgi:hypothetical protein
VWRSRLIRPCCSHQSVLIVTVAVAAVVHHRVGLDLKPCQPVLDNMDRNTPHNVTHFLGSSYGCWWGSLWWLTTVSDGRLYPGRQCHSWCEQTCLRETLSAPPPHTNIAV